MFRCKLNKEFFITSGKLWKEQICKSSYQQDPKPIEMVYNVFENNKKTDKTAAPLVIMHGLFGSKQNWRGVGRALESKLGRRIFTVDARNHGDSPHTEEHSSAHMAADVAYFLQSRNIPKASVMGHSMGGRSMMYFVMTYPHMVERGIIVDISPVSMPRDFSSIEGIFHAMENINVSKDLPLSEGRKVVEEQIKSAVDAKETVEFIMMNLRKRDTGEFYWAPNVKVLHKNLRIFAEFMDHVTHLPPFIGPMMFICGKQSNFVDPDSWPEIKKLFTNAEMHWLDAGHLVHFDQPAEFINLVVDFLDK